MSSGYAPSTPADFFDWLLPDEGWKVICILTPRGMRQIFVRTAEEMEQIALAADARGAEVYHACAVYRTNENRRAENVDYAAAFWLDLDVGREKPYPDISTAARALHDFSRTAQIPFPTVVGSGSGLHCYWPIDTLLGRVAWSAGAAHLAQAADRLRLIVDTSRTEDIASILRPPGTHNHKYDPAPLVACGRLTEPVDTAAFLAKLQAVIGQPSDDLMARALGGLEAGGPPPSMTQGGPEGGRTNALVHRAGWCLGPWHMGLEQAVAACLLWDTFNTPPLGEEVVRKTVTSIWEREEQKGERLSIVPTEPVAAVPYPFFFSEHKQLMRRPQASSETGAPTLVYKAPLYVTGYRKAESGETRTLALRHWLPHDGWQDCVIAWDDTSLKTVMSRLTARGINLKPHAAPHILHFVQASIDDMQNARATDKEFEQMGWKGRSFLIGNELITEAQSALVGVSAEANQRARLLEPQGELGEWVNAANKLFKVGFEAQAFMLLCSFAAPLMRFRLPYGGVIVSGVSMGSGRGKSMALISAFSVWGDRYALDINRCDTQNARFRSIALLANLPIVFDELRDRDPLTVKDFILSFTDGRDKNRLNQDGTLKRLNSGWSTVLISAANVSLADTVSFDNETAQAARVLEFAMPSLPHDTSAADGRDIERRLIANRGTAGRAFLHSLVRDEVIDWVVARADHHDRAFAQRIGAQTETRFYSALLACAQVAGELLNQWGILEFDTARVIEFGLRAAMGMKERIHEQRLEAAAVLSRFINESWGHALILAGKTEGEQQAVPLQTPRLGILKMRYERDPGVLAIDRSHFRRWCVQQNQVMAELEKDLSDLGVIVATGSKRNLGAGTVYAAGGVSSCWVVDVKHAAVSSLPTEVGHRRREGVG